MTAAERLAALLPGADEAALITAPHNRRYLTGFSSSDGCLLITRETAYFLTDFRYIEAAKRSVCDRFIDCREYTRMEDALRTLAEKLRLHKIYLEACGVTLARQEKLRAALPAQLDASGLLDRWIDSLRRIKTPGELKKIRQAQALTEDGFAHILDYIRPGRTERDVALELEFYIRRQGAEAAAFDFIVVSGANTSLPHGVPTEKPIGSGEFVTMDFGAVVEGYHSDMTRTVAVGAVSEEQERVYDIVLQAQLAALSVLKPGLPCLKGDAAARDVIAAAGFGDCFGHGTGHGVGVEIHEQPRLSPSARGQELQAGNVVTVEPGIYIEGKFGVRIEDMAAITESGCENLTKSPKTLIRL